MNDLSKIVLASNNPGKLREFKKLFEPLQIELIPQGELNVPECAEPFHTFMENALAKARHASLLTNLPAIADDSGLIVNALNGAPGVLSARYATLYGLDKSDHNNNTQLIKNLQDQVDRSAAYICVLVLLRHADDPAPIFSQGYWAGEILQHARGANGFGYDPLFYLPDYKLTAAELEPQLKNTISHRAIALKKLIQELQLLQ